MQSELPTVVMEVASPELSGLAAPSSTRPAHWPRLCRRWTLQTRLLREHLMLKLGNPIPQCEVASGVPQICLLPSVPLLPSPSHLPGLATLALASDCVTNYVFYSFYNIPFSTLLCTYKIASNYQLHSL